MKFRIAKKILFSKHWKNKVEKTDRYRPHYNEQGNWILPSFHTYPIKHKAWKVFIKHKSRNKRRIYSVW